MSPLGCVQVACWTTRTLFEPVCVGCASSYSPFFDPFCRDKDTSWQFQVCCERLADLHLCALVKCSLGVGTLPTTEFSGATRRTWQFYELNDRTSYCHRTRNSRQATQKQRKEREFPPENNYSGRCQESWTKTFACGFSWWGNVKDDFANAVSMIANEVHGKTLRTTATSRSKTKIAWLNLDLLWMGLIWNTDTKKQPKLLQMRQSMTHCQENLRTPGSALVLSTVQCLAPKRHIFDGRVAAI